MKDDDSRIEALLARYRPVGPPAELRARVLESAEPRRSRWASAGWLSVAAMLVLSLGLELAADRMRGQTAAMLGVGLIHWTAEAEDAAQMLNGEGSGRRYLTLALAAGGARPDPFPPQVPLAARFSGEIQ